MKFLVLVKVRRDARITPEMAVAHKRVMLEQMGKGEAEAVYGFAGTGAPDGMLILNAKTPELLNELVLSAPGFSVCDLEVHPLVDFATMADQVIDVLKKAGGVSDLGH